MKGFFWSKSHSQQGHILSVGILEIFGDPPGDLSRQHRLKTTTTVQEIRNFLIKT